MYSWGIFTSLENHSLLELKLNPAWVLLLLCGGVGLCRRCLHKITEVIRSRGTFFGAFRWRGKNAKSTGFLARSCRHFTAILFLQWKKVSWVIEWDKEKQQTHCYFHVDFDGLALFKPKVQLRLRLCLFFLDRLCILHILKVVLKCHVEIERVWSILQPDVKRHVLLLLNCVNKTYTKSNSDESRSPVVVLNAEHEISRAVRNWFYRNSGISFDGAVGKKSARRFIFQFDV